MRGWPTKDAAAQIGRFAASAGRTSLSVADQARKTVGRDPSGNQAKDPRERYPSFGTCDDEELPADVELLVDTKPGSLPSHMMAAPV